MLSSDFFVVLSVTVVERYHQNLSEERYVGAAVAMNFATIQTAMVIVSFVANVSNGDV